MLALTRSNAKIPPTCKYPIPDDVVVIWLPKDAFLLIPRTPDGSDFITIIDNQGNERVHWVADEWKEDPEIVMGAIWGAILNRGILPDEEEGV